MVGEYTNKRVGRLIAAGSRSLIDDAVRVISRLKAIHVNEYEDDQEGFNLGTPSDNNDSIGNQLSTYRSIVSQTGAKAHWRPCLWTTPGAQSVKISQPLSKIWFICFHVLTK